METKSWVAQARASTGWMMVAGVIGMVAGGLSIASPLVGGITVTVLVGLAMLIGGVARLFAAFAAGSFGTGALAFLWGLLVATTGFHFMTNPASGLEALTLVLTTVFFVSGLSECIVGFQMKPAAGWGWTLAGGAVTTLLAILLWRQFPMTGVWLVGTMAGVNLFANGLSTVMVGGAVRRAVPEP